MTPRSKRFKLSSFSNKSKLPVTTTTPNLDPIPGIKSCSVQLTDLLSETIAKIGNLEKEVKDLRAFKTQYELMNYELSALTYLVRAPDKPDLIAATGAGKLLNIIASEVTKRIRSSKNAIVFNIPDKTDLNLVRYKLLSACGLNPHAVECLRLRKKQQKYSCPLLFKFLSEADANTFISSQHLLQRNTLFRHIRIIRDRTPLERAFIMKSANTLPSKTLSSNIKSKTSVLDEAVNQQASSSTPNIPQPTSAHAHLITIKQITGTPNPTQVTPVDLDISSSTTISPGIKNVELSPTVQSPKRNIATPNPSSVNSRGRKHHVPSTHNRSEITHFRQKPQHASFTPQAFSYGASQSLANYTHHPPRKTFSEPLLNVHAGSASDNVAIPWIAPYTLPNVAQPPPFIYGPVASSENWQNPTLRSCAYPGFIDGRSSLSPPRTDLSLLSNRPFFPSGTQFQPMNMYPMHPFRAPPAQ